MKDWIKEIIIGLAGLIIGVVLLFWWLDQVILVFEGAIPLIVLFLGVIFLWIGIEDKKLEKELQELEKELESEEEGEEENKSEEKEQK